jgi:glycosyltransferase involved in cell wall biosynthesis
MIVKDEAAIIEQCLQALAPAIDCYVICDTGSTDATIDLIRGVFDPLDIPGEIVHTEFIDFAQARNFALDAARASSLEFDYILLCDADMQLVITNPDWRDAITAPAHQLVQRTVGGREYPNVRLVQRNHPAHYVGMTHEYLAVGDYRPILEGISYFDNANGSSHSHKFERDIQLLEQGLQAEPDNSRYMFYLANSLFGVGRYADAIAWYERRLAIDDHTGERFASSYHIGLAKLSLGDVAGFTFQMLATWDQFPDRAEPLCMLASNAMENRRWNLTVTFARMGKQIPKPIEGLFVEYPVYEWRLDDLLAVGLYWIDEWAEAAEINERILPIVPENHRARIAENLEFCRTRLGEARV